MRAYRSRKSGFTLVEILIVVIILGILAAIVIPQFTNASQDARRNSLTSQLQTIRSQVELYKLQHGDKLPTSLGTGTDDWAEMLKQTNADQADFVDLATSKTGPFGPYLQQPPMNSLNSSSVVGTTTTDLGTGGGANDAGDVGFIVNTTTGKIWATSAKFGFVYNEADPAASTNDQ